MPNKEFIKTEKAYSPISLYFSTDKSYEIDNIIEQMNREIEMNISGKNLYAERISEISKQAIVKIVFYAFVVTISLFSIMNIFNTIYSSVILKKKDFAILKSIGMSKKQMNKILSFECIFYGLDSIFYGTSISIVILYFMYLLMKNTKVYVFSIPWINIVISIIIIYIAIFLAMINAKRSIKNNNVIQEIKSDNI